MFRWTKLAIKNLFNYRTRTILTILGIGISVALIYSIQIVSEGVKVSVEKEAANIFGEHDIHISIPNYSTNLLDSEAIDSLSNMEEVNSYTTLLHGYITLQVRDTEKQILVGNVLADREDESNDEDINGKSLQSGDAVLLQEQYAKELDLEIGDWIELSQNQQTNELQIQGIFSSEESETLFNGVSAVVSNHTIRELLMIEEGFNFIAVDLIDPDATEEIIEEIETLFTEGTIITDQSIISRNLQSSFKDLQSGFIFLTLISIFLGGFIIHHTFNVMVTQRTKDIGTLRALGAKKSIIVAMFLTESIVVGVIGVIVGLGLGIGLGYGLMGYFSNSLGLTKFQFAIPFTGTVLAVSIGILVSFVSAFFPALNAGKKQPVEAFESAHFHIDRPNQKIPIIKPSVGMIIIAIGSYLWVQYSDSSNHFYLILTLLIILIGILLFIPIIISLLLKVLEILIAKLFGLQGKLAALTLSRSKERTTGALTLVIITLTTVIGITVISQSVERGWVDQYQSTLDFEIAISPDEDTEFLDKNLADRILEIKSSHLAVPYNVIFEASEQLNQTIAIYGAELPKYLQTKKIITPSGYADPNLTVLEEGNGMAVSEKVAETLGIDVGDIYELKDGGNTLEIEVGAVYEEMNAGGFSITLPQNIVDEVYAPYGPSGYFVKIDTDLTSEEEWINSFESATWSTGMKASTVNDELEQVRGLVNQMFIPFRVINIVIIIIAVLGVFNSLLISIIERKKEFGLLRSVGADKGQLNQLISMEGIIVGLLGLLVGVPFGLFLGYLITYWWNQEIDSKIKFHLPLGEIIIGCIITVLITWLVSLLTARKVYQDDIVKSFETGT